MPQRDEHNIAAFQRTHPVGTSILATVVRIHVFGAFCRVAGGVEALLLVVDFGRPPPLRFPEDYPKPGDVIEATVCRIYSEQRKIRLSQRVPAGQI